MARSRCSHPGQPAIDVILERYIGDPRFSNLPRKFKTAISGLQDVAHEIHDVAFVGVNHPEHGSGFDLWVGGGLSTNPMLGKQIGDTRPISLSSSEAGLSTLDTPARRSGHAAR